MNRKQLFPIESLPASDSPIEKLANSAGLLLGMRDNADSMLDRAVFAHALLFLQVTEISTHIVGSVSSLKIALDVVLGILSSLLKRTIFGIILIHQIYQGDCHWWHLECSFSTFHQKF